MKVLVIPGSYKGTIYSIDAAEVIADTIHRSLPGVSVEKLVLADGGEGTLETFEVHFGSLTETYKVRNPLGKMVLSKVGYLKQGVAVIESAQAIGHSLVKANELDPFTLSTYGLGELIKCCIHEGIKELLVAMGDSATMDMGVGMLSALGVKFYSKAGEVRYPTLHDLPRIVDFDDSGLGTLKKQVTFVGLVDTDDFLCGKIGQVQLYGRQKGLRDSEISEVESAFFHFSDLIRRHFSIDVTTVIRSTGSGGVAAALHAFLGAQLLNTLDYLSNRLQLDQLIRGADITITGEGCIDNQTRLGKVPYFVATRSLHKCVGIVGKYTKEGLEDMLQTCRGFSIFSMNPDVSMSDPRVALRDITSSIISILGV